MAIVPVGKGLLRYGFSVGQHSEFGGVTPGVHSPTGFHPTDEAIDVTDWRADVGPEYEGGEALSWQERTKRLMQRARQLGTFDEVLGPGDKDHDTHVHLAKRKDRAPLAPEQLEWLGTGRWKQGDGSYSFAMPNPGNATAAPAPAAGGAASEPAPAVSAAPAAPDWRAAASDPNRSRDPMSAAYWQREDIKQWAAANPSLARPLMAAAGAGAPLEALPQPSAPAAPAEDYSFKPLNSGATGGVKVAPLPQLDPAPTSTSRPSSVGTQASPKGLQPYFFEIHADADVASGGKTGLIGSYLDQDNPVFQQLAKEYGTYGENNSRGWRGGDLGAPRRGLSILETRTAGAGMNDPAQQRQAAERLYATLMRDPDVASGRRPLHFYVGHGDTDLPGQQGAANGDAPEKVWNAGVVRELKARIQAAKHTNWQFHDPVIDNAGGANANWTRAQQLRQQWIDQ